MTFTSSAALLDAIVLAVVSREKNGTYGYRITQQVKEVLDLSESALYPALRRLQKNDFLTSHDEVVNGRNRRYYEPTAKGLQQLDVYRAEWKDYSEKVNLLFGGKSQ